MNVKTVVKVMNFHALLRVDSSRKSAEKLEAVEQEILSMMKIILNNKNLIMDQRIKAPDSSLPVFRIFIGSDFGFCGAVNSSINRYLAEDVKTLNTDKVLVGKKLRRRGEIKMFVPQQELLKEENFKKLQEYIYAAVYAGKYSAVQLVYNRYYNMTNIKPEIRQIFPLQLDAEEDQAAYKEDFMVEDLPSVMFNHLTANYICQEIKIALASSYAAENAMRQASTTESIKKLDEKAADELRETRKQRTAVAVSKTIDNFVKQKAIKGGR